MKKNRFRILLIVLGIIFIMTVLYFSINNSVNISFSRIKDFLYSPFLDSNNREDIVGKNLNTEIIEENSELKKITGVDESLSGFTIINATVIERNHSYWLESFTINKGKKDGIDVGNAVVTSEGLIGRIDKITNSTSVVKLITSTSNTNKVSVKIKYKETYLYKIMEMNNTKLIIDGIEDDFDDIGALILTSGLSDLYPSGIVVGTVESIKNNKNGLSKRIYVKSLVDFNNIRFVSVLKRNIR